MYCHKCGKELIIGKMIGYDSRNGSQVFEQVCPSGECGHFGINHDYRRKYFWSWFRCIKCGSTTVPD